MNKGLWVLVILAIIALVLWILSLIGHPAHVSRIDDSDLDTVIISMETSVICAGVQ